LATKIRLKRIGRRNRPFYRLVVMDSRKRRDGAAIEELGWYNPLDKKNPHSFKAERVLHWLGEGAQMTQAAHRLLREEGIVYRWHLIRQGLDEEQIEKEMQKWILRREAAAAEKKTKKKEKPTPAPEVTPEAIPTEAEMAEEQPVAESETEPVAKEPEAEEPTSEEPVAAQAEETSETPTEDEQPAEEKAPEDEKTEDVETKGDDS